MTRAEPAFIGGRAGAIIPFPEKAEKAMPPAKWRPALPYLGALVLAALLYWLAGNIAHTPRPGTLGPDFWPKAAALLIAAAAAFELVRQAATGTPRARTDHSPDDAIQAQDTSAAQPPLHPFALATGAVLTLAYAVVMPVLGFMLASFLLLAGFMYVGGIRNHLAVWTTATCGVLVLAVVFLKIAYVSLPRGVPPFAHVTQAVMTLLQVR